MGDSRPQGSHRPARSQGGSGLGDPRQVVWEVWDDRTERAWCIFVSHTALTSSNSCPFI